MRRFEIGDLKIEDDDDDDGGEFAKGSKLMNAPRSRRWTSCSVTVCWVEWLSAVVVVGVKSTHTTKSDGSQAKGLSEPRRAYCVWISREGTQP